MKLTALVLFIVKGSVSDIAGDFPINCYENIFLDVSEFFYSIQGESSYAGYPCLFIRLTGCNLHCTYCDTRYACEENGKKISIAKLLQFTQKHPTALVAITGGEPLLQQNIYPLINKLLFAKRTVLLETNGSVKLNKVPVQVVKIMDIKCPGSTMHEKVDMSNLDFLDFKDEVKFVLTSQADYMWAVDIIQKYELAAKVRVIMSPVVASLNPAKLARWVLDDELEVRVAVQLHRILWPQQKRGC